LKYNKLRRKQKAIDQEMIFQVVKNNKTGNATKEQLESWVKNVYLSEKWEEEKLNNTVSQVIEEIFSKSAQKDSLSLEEFKNSLDSNDTLWNDNFNFREILTKLADL
jgi:hypothetical protein